MRSLRLIPSALASLLLVLSFPAARPLQAAMEPRFELAPQVIDRSLGRSPSTGREGKRPANAKHRARGRQSKAGRKLAQRASGAPGSHGMGAASYPGETQGTPGPVVNEQEALRQIKRVWDQLIPTDGKPYPRLSLSSPSFSLTLDPQLYPLYATRDGALILVDPKNSIPPLIKDLIRERDPSVRIVSESPANGRRLLASMLASAGFYSVEENFSMDFGRDPKLTVQADFKIEPSSDSVLNQNVVLVNQGRSALAPSLREYLKKNGFSVLDTSAIPSPSRLRSPHGIRVITAKAQPELLDAILKAVSLVPICRDCNLDVFAADDNNGISLSVRADRVVKRNGKDFAICYFDGDPVTYTLFRILETRGYRVVMLDRKDDFRKTAEKIFSELKIRADFGWHDLIREKTSPVLLQMTGFWLEDPAPTGESLFLTNVKIDHTVGSVLREIGYDLNIDFEEPSRY